MFNEIPSNSSPRAKRDLGVCRKEPTEWLASSWLSFLKPFQNRFPVCGTPPCDALPQGRSFGASLTPAASDCSGSLRKGLRPLSQPDSHGWGCRPKCAYAYCVKLREETKHRYSQQRQPNSSNSFPRPARPAHNLSGTCPGPSRSGAGAFKELAKTGQDHGYRCQGKHGMRSVVHSRKINLITTFGGHTDTRTLESKSQPRMRLPRTSE